MSAESWTCAALAAWTLAGCNPHHYLPYELEPADYRAPAVWILTPVNGIIPGQAISNEESERLQQAFLRYARDQGRRVVVVNLLSSSNDSKVGPLARRDELRRLVAQVRNAHPGALTLIPSVVVSWAELTGTNARWDGVVRPIDRLGTSGGEVTGHIEALSLAVTAVDGEGRVVFRSRAGIDVPYEIRGNLWSPRFELRDPLLPDGDDVLDASVDIALRPLVSESNRLVQVPLQDGESERSQPTATVFPPQHDTRRSVRVMHIGRQ